MRRPLIAGNWKMNLNRAEAVSLASAVASRAAQAGHVDLAVCPPAVYLDAVAAALEGSPVALGAQNMYFESNGAFTGEISGSMLQDLGCRYVILGHSERRHILGETDQDVNRKVKLALQLGLVPIVCVGETLAQREAGRTQEVVAGQFTQSLAGLTDSSAAAGGDCLRTGLGHRHRQGGHARAGGGGACRSSHIDRKQLQCGDRRGGPHPVWRQCQAGQCGGTAVAAEY